MEQKDSMGSEEEEEEAIADEEEDKQGPRQLIASEQGQTIP